ncbi:31993_t:CDS:2 [Gigaspora margarita]|uniref:31993_t:CDS:1 n=1 Tax=Gigaspora margarita TaxID=4874 RepID=A0ABM8W602_GIGMA|nr:31993_t:CDS:2 [Gigaspora margarita]
MQQNWRGASCSEATLYKRQENPFKIGVRKHTYLAVKLRNVPLGRRDLISNEIKWAFESFGTIKSIKQDLRRGCPDNKCLESKSHNGVQQLPPDSKTSNLKKRGTIRHKEEKITEKPFSSSNPYVEAKGEEENDKNLERDRANTERDYMSQSSERNNHCGKKFGGGPKCARDHQ